jgi:hypothetical protein
LLGFAQGSFVFWGCEKKNFFRNLTNPISPLFCKWLIGDAKFDE